MSKEHKTGKTYAEKLRDPRWQKKRMEVMERDKFACRRCGDSTSTLNVHHICYISKTEPWDYHANSLVTLCEECHKHAENWKVRHDVGQMACASIEASVLQQVVKAILESNDKSLTYDLGPSTCELHAKVRAKELLLNALVGIQTEITNET